MRRWIITIISVWMAVCSIEHAYANSKSIAKMGLLRQLAQTAAGDTIRCRIFYQLVKVSENVQVEYYYINKLLEEADAQNSNKWRAEAYLTYMYFGYNSFQPAEVYKWMSRLEAVARKEKLYDLMFLGKRCVTDMMILDREYERAEKDAGKVLQEARRLNNKVGIAAAVNSLSNVYQVTYREAEAARILEENYATMLEAGNNLSLEASNSLITIYSNLDDRPNWLKWLKLQDRNIHDLAEKNAETEYRMQIWKLMNSIHYLSFYSTIDNRMEAEKYLKLTEKYNMEGYNTIGMHYHPVRYTYFLRTGQYEKALEEVEALIDINKETSPWVYNSNYFMKAAILRELERTDEALDIYKKAFAIKDSLQVKQIDMQVEQLKNDYNTNTLQLERERIDRNTQTILLVLAIIVLVILIYYMVNAYRVRSSLRKSEQEMRQMSDEMELANVAKENFLSGISSVISVPLNATVKEAMLLATEKALDGEERKRIANDLNNTSAELMKLINNILDLSRLEAGMMRLQVSEIEMVMLMQSLVDASNLHEAGTVLAILPKQSFMIHVDATRLSQVVNSLLHKGDSLASGKPLLLVMNLIGNGKVFVSVKGTALANRVSSQEQVVINEVNRMIIEHSGGTYEIHSKDVEPFVCFTL